MTNLSWPAAADVHDPVQPYPPQFPALLLDLVAVGIGLPRDHEEVASDYPPGLFSTLMRPDGSELGRIIGDALIDL